MAAISALFTDADVAKFRARNLAGLASYIAVDALADDDIVDALVAAESEASHALRVLFQPTVIIPEDAPQSEVDALVAAGTPYRQEPAYDYDPTEWTMDAWGYLILRQKPIIRVDSVRFTYPQPMNDVLTVPNDWLRLDKKYGQVRFVPTGSLMGLGPLSTYLLQSMSSGRVIPNMIHVRYTAGLEDAKRDYPDLLALVRRMAALRLLKDAYVPQSGSISADGLSQSNSVDTDKWQDGIERDLEALRQSIHGIRMAVL